MKKKIIWVAIIIIVLAAIGGAIGLYFFYKPVKNFSTSTAEFTTTAKELFAEFEKDADAANAKYVTKDKTLQVSGKIAEIDKNSDGASIIFLEVANPEGAISCTLIGEDSAKAAKYKKGDSITIKGQCTGYQELINKEVIMIRCGIVE